MNNSPQARPRPDYLKTVPETNSQEAEENAVCAIWQHWNEAIKLKCVARAVLIDQQSTFKLKESRLLIRELILADGDTERAQKEIAKTGWGQFDSVRRLIVICKNFPQSVAAAVRFCGGQHA